MFCLPDPCLVMSIVLRPHGDPCPGPGAVLRMIWIFVYIVDRLSLNRVYDFHLADFPCCILCQCNGGPFPVHRLAVLLSWNVLVSLRAIGNWQLAILAGLGYLMAVELVMRVTQQLRSIARPNSLIPFNCSSSSIRTGIFHVFISFYRAVCQFFVPAGLCRPSSSSKCFLLKLMKIDKKLSWGTYSRSSRSSKIDNWISKSQVDKTIKIHSLF